jgi:hypothetical protein
MSKDSVAAAMAALMDSNLILASPALQLTQHVSHVSVKDLAQKNLALQGATIITASENMITVRPSSSPRLLPPSTSG